MAYRLIVALVALASFGLDGLLAQGEQLTLPVTLTAFAVSPGGVRTPAGSATIRSPSSNFA